MVTLRPATPDDMEPLFELYRDAFQPHIEQIWGWNEEWQRENFGRDFNSSSTSVIEADSQLVGYVQTDLQPHEVYIRNMALRADARGRGIGGEVVRLVQGVAIERGVPLRLRVFLDNPRAEVFWERMGFTKGNRSDAQIEMSWPAA